MKNININNNNKSPDLFPVFLLFRVHRTRCHRTCSLIKLAGSGSSVGRESSERSGRTVLWFCEEISCSSVRKRLVSEGAGCGVAAVIFPRFCSSWFRCVHVVCSISSVFGSGWKQKVSPPLSVGVEFQSLLWTHSQLRFHWCRTGRSWQNLCPWESPVRTFIRQNPCPYPCH